MKEVEEAKRRFVEIKGAEHLPAVWANYIAEAAARFLVQSAQLQAGVPTARGQLRTVAINLIMFGELIEAQLAKELDEEKGSAHI